MDEVEPKRVRADATQRAQRAAELRVAGLTWSAIALDIGMTEPGNVRRLVQRYYAQVPDPDRVEAKKVMRDRQELLWSHAVEDVQEGRAGSLRAAVALLQRASSLDGLDEPTRSSVVASPEQFEAAVQMLTAQARRDAGFADPVDVDVCMIEDAEVIEDE